MINSRPDPVVASAPGRLDVMGGIADYSGSLVLEMPLSERARVWARKRTDGLWRVQGMQVREKYRTPVVSATTRDLRDLSAARAYFSRNPQAAWAAYVLGAVPVLLRAKRMPPSGADLILEDLQRARETGDASRLPFGGYLAEIQPGLFESRYRPYLPERMTGREFLVKAVSIDRATSVRPGRSYRVRAAARHPIAENHRVGLFRDLLSGMARGTGDRVIQLSSLGTWMYESHASYSACGLTEPVTDRIVEAALAAGPPNGVYGAKITGGGSGGTVCLLAEGKKGLDSAVRIACRFSKARKPFMAVGSSDGARWS